MRVDFIQLLCAITGCSFMPAYPGAWWDSIMSDDGDGDDEEDLRSSDREFKGRK